MEFCVVLSGWCKVTPCLALSCLVLLCLVWPKINLSNICLGGVRNFGCNWFAQLRNIIYVQVWNGYSYWLKKCMLKITENPGKARQGTRQGKARPGAPRQEGITWFWKIMMTSLDGSIFCVTGPLWGESSQRASNALVSREIACVDFFIICTRTNGWTYNRDAGDLRRHHAYYDVTNDSVYFSLLNCQATVVTICGLIHSTNWNSQKWKELDTSEMKMKCGGGLGEG